MPNNRQSEMLDSTFCLILQLCCSTVYKIIYYPAVSESVGRYQNLGNSISEPNIVENKSLTNYIYETAPLVVKA